MELSKAEIENISQVTSQILETQGKTREKLITILQKIQEEMGYLPQLAMEKVAEALEIPAVDVYELATFYNQFRLHPPGEHHIEVCMGTACYMVGGEVAMDSFQRRLEIKEGETTSDRKFSLDRVACVGCCSLAPVVVVDNEIEKHVTPTRVDGILLAYEEEDSDATSENIEKVPSPDLENRKGEEGE